MPKVKIEGKVKHFPYTKAGKAAAKAMENRKKMKKKYDGKGGGYGATMGPMLKGMSGSTGSRKEKVMSVLGK